MADQRVFQDNEAALASWLVERPPGLIVFDGLPYAGKTTLAKNIGSRLGWPQIDGDAFVDGVDVRFVSQLRSAELTGKVQQLLAHAPRVLHSETDSRLPLKPSRPAGTAGQY